MFQIDIPTIALYAWLTDLMSMVAIGMLWRINPRVDGIAQFFQMNVVKVMTTSIQVGDKLFPGFMGPIYVPNTALTLLTATLALEASLRFRGYHSRTRWKWLFVLIPLYFLLSFAADKDPVTRVFAHDFGSSSILLAAGVTMVWNVNDRNERTIFTFIAFFMWLLAAGLSLRGVMALNTSYSPRALEMPFNSITYTVSIICVIGWAGSVIFACYYRVNREALRLSREDGLTGLANRRSLDFHMKQELANGYRAHNTFGIVLVDLNRFKEINDLYGHPTGDAVLVEFARRLKAFARESDVTGRLGGDEFLLIVRGAHATQGEMALKRLKETVTGPFVFGNTTLMIDVSAGMAIWPNDGDSVEALYKCADRRMYEDKAHSRRTRDFALSEDAPQSFFAP